MVCYATLFHPGHQRPIATALYFDAQVVIGSASDDTAHLLQRFFAIGQDSLTPEIFLRRCDELCASGMRVELGGPPPWTGSSPAIDA